MRLIVYLGPGHRLVLSDGRVVLRGEEAEVSDAEADYMARSPHVWIDVLASSAPRKRGRRPEAESGEGREDNPGESPGEQEE